MPCICLFVCVFVCLQYYEKTFKSIAIKLSENNKNGFKITSLNLGQIGLKFICRSHENRTVNQSINQEFLKWLK